MFELSISQWHGSIVLGINGRAQYVLQLRLKSSANDNFVQNVLEAIRHSKYVWQVVEKIKRCAWS